MTTGDRRAEVLKLHYVDGLSIRAIAKRLRMARKTVRKHLGVTKPKPVTTQPRASLLDPYEDAIRKELVATPEMTAPAMLERLRPLGYVGGVSILRERMRTLRPGGDPRAFDTIHYAPGQAMQVDWADFAFALPGIPRRVNAFVAVLGFSRMLYLEFSLSQKMGTFLRCMERAIAFFGGVTAMDIFDNMKTVVLEHRPPREPLFNPRFLSYATARGFAPFACAPHSPHEKGKVERPISFVRSRFWPGRRFIDLADLNRQAFAWRDTYANGREHSTTGKVPALVFEHTEKAALRPAGASRFDTDDRDHAGVNKTYRVRFDRNTYSVPWRLVGQQVHVRGDDHTVRVFLGHKLVAEHARCWDVATDIEDPTHRRGPYRERRGAHELPEVLVDLGESGKAYFKALSATTRSIRRETERLIFLVEIFGPDVVLRALTEVMTTGHVGVEYIEFVLRHRHQATPAPNPLRLGRPELDDVHVPAPDLGIYDVVRTRDPGRPPKPTTESDDE